MSRHRSKRGTTLARTARCTPLAPAILVQAVSRVPLRGLSARRGLRYKFHSQVTYPHSAYTPLPPSSPSPPPCDGGLWSARGHSSMYFISLLRQTAVYYQMVGGRKQACSALPRPGVLFSAGEDVSLLIVSLKTITNFPSPKCFAPLPPANSNGVFAPSLLVMSRTYSLLALL